MKFRLWYFTALTTVLLLLFAGIHRLVYQILPNEYDGHWSEEPVVYLTLGLIIMIPIQGIAVLLAIPKRRRKLFIPNLAGFIAAIVVFFLVTFIIDPMILLYAT